MFSIEEIGILIDTWADNFQKINSKEQIAILAFIKNRRWIEVYNDWKTTITNHVDIKYRNYNVNDKNVVEINCDLSHLCFCENRWKFKIKL